MAEPVLITIPISHYCEKARWALDRAGIDYHERRYLQGFHRIAALRFDTVLGPEGRRWLYHEASAAEELFVSFNLTGLPAWQRRTFPLTWRVITASSLARAPRRAVRAAHVPRGTVGIHQTRRI